jgi:chromosome segregation ATPase
MTKPGDLPTNNWEEEYKKEHKLRQEAEGELTIVKGISVHMSPEMRDANAKIKELRNSLDRFKKENNDCYNRIADLTESLESKDYFKDPDYKYLIDENRRLEAERNELLTDNKKLARQIEDKIDKLRKSGL